MKKEDLIAMGLTEEQAKKVMDSLDGNFVTKARFNEVNEENKTLKQSVADRDKQLEDLKKSSGDNAELKKQIETLQQQNADQKKAHDAEMAQLKLDNTSIFRQMMVQYKDTGEDIYFEIQISNEDPTSGAGRQTMILIDCNIDGGILAKFDADGEYLDEDMDFTFEDFKMPEAFKDLDGFLTN